MSTVYIVSAGQMLCYISNTANSQRLHMYNYNNSAPVY
jgi:hypothetical protein